MTATLYAALAGPSTASDLYVVDSTDAVMVDIGPIGDAISGMAVDPTDGTLYGCVSSNSTGSSRGDTALVTIDTATGAETVIGMMGDRFHEIAFDSTGQLWGLSGGSTGLWSVDKTTGVATVVNPSGDRIDGGAFDFDGSDVLWLVGGFVSGVNSGNPCIGTIDTTTGLFTLVGTPSDNQYQHSGKFDPSIPGLMWASSPGEAGSTMGTDLVTTDTSTFTVTNVGTFTTPRVGALAWAGPPILTAAFHATPPVSGFATLSVHFHDDSIPGPSGPITGWNWDFGDGGNSTAQNPTHNYTVAGTYTVTLTVTGTSPDGTSSHIRSHYIHVFDPADFTLYAALAGTHTTSDLYTVDPSDASMVSVGPIGYAVSGMAQDPISRDLYGVTSANSGSHPRALITIDPVTGAGTLVADINGPYANTIHDIAFDSTGQLWGSEATGGNIVKIDPTTATTTVVGGGGSYSGGLDFDNVGQFWKVGYNPDNIATLSTVNGAPTLIAHTSDGNPLHSGKFDPANFFWASGPGQSGAAATNLVTVDVGTGTVTNIGTFTVAGVGALCWYNSSPPPPDFSASLVPNSITVSDGISTLVHLNTHAFHGDTETITLSATSPGSFTVTFPDNPITAGDIDVPIDVAVGSPGVGTYTITIHCVGTDNSHDVVLTVHVLTIVPGFHLAS